MQPQSISETVISTHNTTCFSAHTSSSASGPSRFNLSDYLMGLYPCAQADKFWFSFGFSNNFIDNIYIFISRWWYLTLTKYLHGSVSLLRSYSRCTQHCMESDGKLSAYHWPISRTGSIKSTTSSPIYVRSILILSSHLRSGFPSGLLSSDFHTEMLMHFLSLATCRVNLILRRLIVLIIFDKKYKFWCSSIRTFLEHPSKIPVLSSATFYRTLSFLVFLLMCDTEFHTHTRL
jgi:hypothetical protein